MSRTVYTDAERICQSIEALTEEIREQAPPMAEARLRLTCAALTGLITRESTDVLDAKYAVQAADACLALLYPEVPK